MILFYWKVVYSDRHHVCEVSLIIRVVCCQLLDHGLLVDYAILVVKACIDDKHTKEQTERHFVDYLHNPEILFRNRHDEETI